MLISNEEAEKLIEQYRDYPEKIVRRFYYFVEPAVKDELCHVGMIGLWKGIFAYYKKSPDTFDSKEFVNTICTYIRYEMADLFHELKLIRISDNQWHNFVKAKRLISTFPDATEEQLKSIITNAGLRYDWYIKAKEIVNPASLDMEISEDNNADIYEFLFCFDEETHNFESQSYVDYIIDSAMYGIKLDRDKNLICSWIESINNGKELDFTELGKMYEISACMVGVIISRFVDICRFVRDCEYEYLKNQNGTIHFPEIAQKNKTHNGKKIPGVKWILRNRKWKVEITIGKKKSVYLGHFKNYEDAVRARRDAEIKYRGSSDIEI